MKPINVTINRLKLCKKWTDSLVVGSNAICKFIKDLIEREKEKLKRYPVLAFDDFPGVEWSIVSILTNRYLKERDLSIETIDGFSLYKPPEDIWHMIEPYITGDPSFGRVFDGDLEDFLDMGKVGELKEKIEEVKKEEKSHLALICFGCGIANRLLRKLYDYIFYLDLSRTEFLKRIHERQPWFVPREATLEEQAADVGLSVQAFKLSQYVCYPVFDKHKRDTLNRIDFYVESSKAEEPVLYPRKTFEGVLSTLVSHPIRLKPTYISSPWGGQWIKKVRGLPNSFINCAWCFEAITPEMDVGVDSNGKILKIPFLTILSRKRKQIMGDMASKKFGWIFPIRIHYDDSWGGGNMAIQVHPTTLYMKEHFNEPLGQHESYYILATKPGSKVYLGMKEGIDLEEFRKDVKKAESKGIPLDYDRYVNSIPSKPGDLFLIPAGTIHALGKDQVCLEIGTTYGYTFHVYDYLRPDLNGRLRPIHLDHAFSAMKSYRKANWIAQHLRQLPKVLRRGNGWAEYLIGKVREIPYEVRRLEFIRKIEDNTRGKFHLLTLIEGENIKIRSCKKLERYIRINFSETVIIPACFGEYVIVNMGKEPCKILKVLLKSGAH
jgi:mannose-6-phosphate isomerase class I